MCWFLSVFISYILLCVGLFVVEYLGVVSTPEPRSFGALPSLCGVQCRGCFVEWNLLGVWVVVPLDFERRYCCFRDTPFG